MDFSKFWLKNKIVAFQGRACSSTFLHMIAVRRRFLQPDTEEWEMLQRPPNRVLGKCVRNTLERWVLVLI